MPVRNCPFPSVPSPAALGFNARGVVVAPKFNLSMPQGRVGAINAVAVPLARELVRQLGPILGRAA